MKYSFSQSLILTIVCAAILFAPAFAIAAYNDVTLTTDTVISVGGYTLNVSGSSAVIESIVVNPSSFSVTLASGSSFSVSSQTLNQLSSDVTSDVTDNTCTGSASSITLAYSGSVTITNVITPSAAICTTVSSGGGGSISVPTVPNSGGSNPLPAPSAPGLSSAQVASILSLLASFGADSSTIENVRLALTGSVSTTVITGSTTTLFTRDLHIGLIGEDVRALQIFLNSHGYTVSSSGPGSLGKETTLFGSLTRAAVIKYQKVKGITPAVGYFGPKTKASLAL